MAATAGNALFARAIADLFGTERDADAVVRFYVEVSDEGTAADEDAVGSELQRGAAIAEGALEVDAPAPNASLIGPRAATSAAGSKRPASPLPAAGELAGSATAVEPCRKARKAERTVGEPLPVHTLVLRHTSERFRAKIDRWESADASQGGDASTAASSAPCSSGRRELRVLLNSADDEPAARAAIRFAYTGQVAAGSMQEVLAVRRLAGYLGVEGGQAACDAKLAARLSSSRSVSNSNSRADAGGGGSSLPAVLKFFACADLFPGASEEAGFAAVLDAAKAALTPHFRDALTTLNTPPLVQQLQRLPAVAVEALLASEGFGTDTEDSVLLLLATWMKPNFSRTDAPTRERLAKLVRLVQLSRPYLMTTLPALVTDYVLGKDSAASPAAWLPVCTREAAFIAWLASARQLSRLPGAPSEAELKVLVDAGGRVWDMKAPRYSFTPRPQCVPAGGMSYSWSISRSYLKQALAGLEPGETLTAYGTFEGSASGALGRGVEWRPYVSYKHGATAARVFLSAWAPDAYKLMGSSTQCGIGLTAFDGRHVIHRWADGKRQDAQVDNYTTKKMSYVQLATGWGWPSVLPLRQAPAGAAADPLAAWADYLGPDGCITGTLTLLPPQL